MAVEVSLLGRAGAGWEQRWARAPAAFIRGLSLVHCCVRAVREQGCVCTCARARADARLLRACLPGARVVSQAPLFLLFAFVFTCFSKK